MKKIVVKIISLTLLVSLIFFLYLSSASFCLKKLDGEFEAYKNSSSSLAKIVPLSKVEMYFTVGKTGESVEIEKTTDIENLLIVFNAKLVMVEKIDCGVSYYAYSNEIPYLTKLKGQKVNLHVFVGKEKIKVGAPLIYGSF